MSAAAKSRGTWPIEKLIAQEYRLGILRHNPKVGREKDRVENGIVIKIQGGKGKTSH
jgi:hypothetical protein